MRLMTGGNQQSTQQNALKKAFAERTMLARRDTTVEGIAAYVEKSTCSIKMGLYKPGEALRDRIGADVPIITFPLASTCPKDRQK
jgi:hypothetical protein